MCIYMQLVVDGKHTARDELLVLGSINEGIVINLINWNYIVSWFESPSHFGS